MLNWKLEHPSKLLIYKLSKPIEVEKNSGLIYIHFVELVFEEVMNFIPPPVEDIE